MGITHDLVGKSPAIIEVLRFVAKVAPTDSTVLIQGESGTGKELLARAMHVNSERARRLFITINCGAIPRELVESELFGHEKAAFTGATERKKGKFEAAGGGTMFCSHDAGTAQSAGRHPSSRESFHRETSKEGETRGTGTFRGSAGHAAESQLAGKRP